MKIFSRLFSSLILILTLNISAQGQGTFSVEEYQAFLESTENLTYNQILDMHPAGFFKSSVSVNVTNASYLDEIKNAYGLTDQEKDLLGTNGFMVSERLTPHSFATAFDDIFCKDLPVYISTDAILHALHRSYDQILIEFEKGILIPRINQVLENLLQYRDALNEKYSSNSDMLPMLRDVDVYTTIAALLAGLQATPYYEENISKTDSLLSFIEDEQQVIYPLFSNTERMIDFSQFTVRGHYTEDPALRKYFKTMIWLGKIELYLNKPVTATFTPNENDIQRQTIDVLLLAEGMQNSNSSSLFSEIEEILLYFIGESDNTTLPQIIDLVNDLEITAASELLDDSRLQAFKDLLFEKFDATQRINSHILYSNPFNPTQIKPAAAFLLFGQRFIVDSYVTGQLVYDKIIYNGEKVQRLLPSSLDVLYALGNDASLQLLKGEIEHFHYASNLAACRYLIDAYDDNFWNSSLYNSWLQSIRQLSAPADRSKLPAFMQSAAWWQQKMNSQLAAWSQLRHDNLLYAKQSYTGVITCSYPYGYIEPVPEFYRAVKSFSQNALHITAFAENDHDKTRLTNFFTRFSSIMDTLGTLAQKELDQQIFNDRENNFIQSVSRIFDNGCGGPSFSGWYSDLYWIEEDSDAEELIIADIHTEPNYGSVMHVGTGPLNMAIIIADVPDKKNVAFIGPVLSYYEHVTTNFKRLTDDEWKNLYNAEPSFRPDFVNAYLANSAGEKYPEGIMLLTNMSPDPDYKIATNPVLAQNYPNPFNGSTTISFSIPSHLSYKNVNFSVYDIKGGLVCVLINETLPSGHYSTRWDARTGTGGAAASGIYFYKLTVADKQLSGKMLLVK